MYLANFGLIYAHKRPRAHRVKINKWSGQWAKKREPRGGDYKKLK